MYGPKNLVAASRLYRRGLLLEKHMAARMTKGVVGRPGKITPMAPNTKDTKPNAFKTSFFNFKSHLKPIVPNFLPKVNHKRGSGQPAHFVIPGSRQSNLAICPDAALQADPLEPNRRTLSPVIVMRARLRNVSWSKSRIRLTCPGLDPQ